MTWRPDRFPKVNDVMLAEALRQLIPVAETAVRSERTNGNVGPFRRAEIILSMWTRQERGRAKKLGGPLPPTAAFPDFTFTDDPANPDQGQTVPADCERPKRAKRKRTPEGPPPGTVLH